MYPGAASAVLSPWPVGEVVPIIDGSHYTRFMKTIPPPETFYVDSTRIACDGEEVGVPGGGHPRVWLQMGANGYADCGYCDRRFVLTGGPADTRGA